MQALIPPGQANGLDKIAPEVQKAMQSLRPGERLTVIVRLKEQVNLNKLAAAPIGPNRAARLKGVIETLQRQANLSQQSLKALLTTRQAEQRVGEVTYFWIFNGLAIEATPAVILELAARPEVAAISSNQIAPVLEPVLPPQPGEIGIFSTQPNLALINVSALWDLGYQGQGIVVASLDTGVDVTHPDLGPKWRGGSNSWYDPYGQHPTTPTDIAGSSSGHGTETMGVMVGGEDAGVAFGVAPQARWIAAKIFPDAGPAQAQTAKFHLAFQWLLDPDGNPATPDAPNVVNNSWTYGGPNVCSLEFQADLQALRAAGILPIFAAGNFGSASSTSASPANNPEAFAVGAVNNSNIIRSDSSRGPRPAGTACDDGTVFPEVVAPGTGIHTTYPMPTKYSNASGTSLAAPHVAGGLALLLNAYPPLTQAEQESVLLNNVVDLGAASPDNSYGQGRIDLLAALTSLSANLSLSQSASATSTVANATLAYSLTITNSGPMTATGTTLNDPLPFNVALASVTPSQGSCLGANIITCSLGDVAPGSVVTVTLMITPLTAGMITHTVTITSARPDLTMENNVAVANTSVIAQVFLPVLLK